MAISIGKRTIDVEKVLGLWTKIIKKKKENNLFELVYKIPDRTEHHGQSPDPRG